MKKLLLSLMLFALSASMVLGVTQTGNLIITVMSEEGQLLPGATVMISSNVLMGTRTQTTDVNGRATFRMLPPGEYVAEVTMDGFKPIKKENIILRIQKISKEEIKLELGEAVEYITVVDITPIVDTTSSTTSVEFDFNHYINHMPTYKHYTTIVGFAGGAQAGNNPSVLGAGQYSNLYLVDGVNTTDMTTQTWGSQFTIDTVQDMSFQLTGVNAEYGYLQGGLLNMVTKSGSNELHGVARLEMKRLTWNDRSYNGDEDIVGTQKGADEDRWDISGGGPLYPDVIWWYVGYTKRAQETVFQRWLSPVDPTAEGLVDWTRPYTGHFLNIKGTIQPTEDIKLMGHYKEDPIEIINDGSSRYFGPKMLPSADITQMQGGDSTYVLGSWVFAENAFIEGRWNDTNSDLSVYANKESDYATAASYIGPVYQSVDGWTWGSSPWWYISARDHDLVAFDLNYLLETATFGEHDIKGGYEYMDAFPQTQFTVNMSGENIQTSAIAGRDFDEVTWLRRLLYAGERLPLTGHHVKYNNFYIQDSAQLMDKLTVNFGVRTEDITGINNHDEEIMSYGVGERIAPRVGFAYDLGGSSVHGSYGRFYDTLDPYVVGYFDTYDFQEVLNYYRPADYVDAANPGDGRNGWAATPYRTVYAGGLESPHSINPDIESQYMDEFALGFDYLIDNNMSVGVVGMWRRYNNLVIAEDLDYDGAYYFTNLDSDAHGSLYKEFLGVIVNFRKRPTEDNLFLAASFSFMDATGITANTTTASDFIGLFATQPWYNPDDIDNWWGDMGQPKWSFKLQGTYFFPNGWYLGAQFTWEDGFGWSTIETVVWDGAHGTGGEGEYYDRWPNGANDIRLPDLVNLDLQFGIEQPVNFPFDVPFTDNAILIGIYANILNALNIQDADRVEQYIDSSNYGNYVRWIQARRYELGFRIEL